MSLIDQDNRARHSGFLSALAAACVGRAVAVYGDAQASPESKALALAVVADPVNYAAKFAPVIAAGKDVAACGPAEPVKGNGLDYCVEDKLIEAELETAWPMLVAAFGG